MLLKVNVYYLSYSIYKKLYLLIIVTLTLNNEISLYICNRWIIKIYTESLVLIHE